MNKLTLIGFVIEIGELYKDESGSIYTSVVIEVDSQRDRGDDEDIKDKIRIKFYDFLAKEVHSIAKKGNLMGIEGSIIPNYQNDEAGVMTHNYEIKYKSIFICSS